jgi:hypothetical protein
MADLAAVSYIGDERGAHVGGAFDKVPEIVFGYDRAKDHRRQGGCADL